MNITSKGQKDLDEALRAIKAKNNSSHTSSSSSSSSYNYSSKGFSHSTPYVPSPQTGFSKQASVFGEIEDEDEQEDTVVKHVPQGVSGMNKTSTRTGRGFTSISYISDENNTNNLRLHKPTHQYFGEKLERLQRSEEETKNKSQSDLEIQSCRAELKQIREMILAERAKISICVGCRLKFPSKEDLLVHEASEPHKVRCTEERKKAINEGKV